jgi:hypothetical protein
MQHVYEHMHCVCGTVVCTDVQTFGPILGGTGDVRTSNCIFQETWVCGYIVGFSLCAMLDVVLFVSRILRNSDSQS